MKDKKMRIIAYLLAVISLLTAAVLYPRLPEQIPTNWSIDGTVTYGAKSTLFCISGMGLLFAVLFDVLPKIDPRRQNYQKFGSYYDMFCVFMQIFLLLVNGILITETFRPGTLSVPMILILGIGILFLFIGNIMPKIKSNFYMGIRTPWTISSEEVWYKTHRLGGKCFFLAGLLSILLAFLPMNRQLFYGAYTAIFLIACLIPGIMSYIWWRQEQQKNH